MDIKQALTTLDPTNDEHWTIDGLPRLDALSAAVGSTVTRKAVNDEAPAFSRTNPSLAPPVPAEAAPPAPAPAAPVAPPVASAPPAPPAPPPAPAAPPAPAPAEEEQPRCRVRALDMPVADVLRSRELVEQALKEVEEEAADLIEDRKDIDAALKKLYSHSEVLSRHLQLMTKTDKNKARDEIQQYLRRSHETRAQRANAARRFVEAGTTAKDVAAAMQPASKIDQAMAKRKPGIGTSRPVPRAPAGTV